MNPDSVFTLASSDTLKSICIKWNTGKNFFSPILKIDNKECEVEWDGNSGILKEESVLSFKEIGAHKIQFECQLFVSDEEGIKLTTHRIEQEINRLAPEYESLWKKTKFFVYSYWQWLLLIFLIYFLIWRYQKILISYLLKLLYRLKNKEEPKKPIETSDSLETNKDSKESVVHFDSKMKKEGILKQLQALIDVTSKHTEPQKDNVFSKFLKKFNFYFYALNKRKQQEQSEEFSHLLSNLHLAIKDGLVDIEDFNVLIDNNKKLIEDNGTLVNSRDTARRAAEILYKDQLLFLLEHLYYNFFNTTSNNEQLKSMIELFDKEIDSSDPTKLASCLKQEQIEELIAEIELCFVSVNKKADWCKKYNTIYGPEDSVDTFVDVIYKKGIDTAHDSDLLEIKRLNDEIEQLTIAKNALDQEKAQLSSSKRGLETEIDQLKGKLRDAQTELQNRPVINVPVLPDIIRQKIDKLNIAHKTEVDDLNATIDGLKEMHNKGIEKLEKEHETQLATINSEHERKIDELNKTHKTEVDALNDAITNLDSTIKELNKEHKKVIEDLKKKHKKQFDGLNTKHTKAIEKINQSHAEEVKVLVATPNSWCNNFIEEVHQLLVALGLELHNLQTSVEDSPNYDRPIFVDAVKEMTQFFSVFETNVNKLCDEKGNQVQKDLPTIRESLLKVFIKVLGYSGSWVNRLLLFECYSRVPQLAEQMQKLGLDVATIERASAFARALLAKVGISVVEPAVLAAPFKSDSYDFENTDVQIYRFFPEISPQDFNGRVFDIIRVGFNVIGGEKKKPVVVYY